jgi:hypothetical protein
MVRPDMMVACARRNQVHVNMSLDCQESGGDAR